MLQYSQSGIRTEEKCIHLFEPYEIAIFVDKNGQTSTIPKFELILNISK